MGTCLPISIVYEWYDARTLSKNGSIIDILEKLVNPGESGGWTDDATWL